MHILVIRFSAMGDVAMTVPVIRNLLHQHPSLRITFVSNAFLAPLFDGIERCQFFPAHLKERHKGLRGMYGLYRELAALPRFDGVADLHNVLRSRILGLFFKKAGLKVSVLDKGRSEKKALTRKDNKECRQLTPMHDRYQQVFAQLGLPVFSYQDIQPVKKNIPTALLPVFATGKPVIGVAPFAQYREKMYPLEKMKSVVQQLAAANNVVLLFGGGPEETAVLQQWEQDIFSVFNIAGRYTFQDELAIISNLNLVVSMDSANMHFASIFNVPVVSVWGATHPFAGFYGWRQPLENAVQVDLYCRPCSVFGNKPCYRGDHACMNTLDEALIIAKVNQVLLAGGNPNATSTLHR
ncbi:MAG: glycosyltransferase family 9 protein [Ferruginibacter sp.]|nr:glycosyltransferase family 9 protein [Ferruginibacter sp.]